MNTTEATTQPSHAPSKERPTTRRLWVRRAVAIGLTGLAGYGVSQSPAGPPIGTGLRVGYDTVAGGVTGAYDGFKRGVRDSTKVKIPPISELPVTEIAQPGDGADNLIARDNPAILTHPERRYEVEQIIDSQIPANQHGVIMPGEAFHLPKK